MSELNNDLLVGINKPWFADAYDHDFGYNQLSESRLFDDTYPDPSKPDYNPKVPELSKHPRFMDSFFSHLGTDHGLSFVRVWAFERFEGLRFNDDFNITGLDPTLLQNLARLFSRAEESKLKIYLCLHDTWGLFGPVPELIESKKHDHDILKASWLKAMTKIISKQSGRQRFYQNVLRPVLDRLYDSTGMFAVDLLNEPEGLIQNSTITIDDVTSYVGYIADRIHDDYGIKVSCGFQKSQTIRENFSELGMLDFIDYHIYNDTGSLEKFNPSLYGNKMGIIGECGLHPIKQKPRQDPRQNLRVLDTILKNVSANGYSGVLPWIDDYVNADALLKRTKEFSKSKSSNPICFIATEIYGENHTKTKKLRQFRDVWLMKNQAGRLFVYAYYALSPRCLFFIKKSGHLRKITTALLDMFVYILDNKTFDANSGK